MRLGFALGKTPGMFGMLASLTRGEYEGKATRNLWLKLPLAILQVIFRMKHRELKAIT